LRIGLALSESAFRNHQSAILKVRS